MTQKITKKMLLLGICSIFGMHSYAQFSGNINVGTGQTYTSLTNTGGLFDAINNGSVTGNVTIKITSNLTAETGAVALNKWTETGVGNYKVSIVPDGTTERLIAGKSLYLLTLSGATNVSINGSPTNDGNKYLRFRNDSTAATGSISTIRFLNDAKRDTIQNCYVEGAGTTATSGVILLGASTGTSGNDSISILNNVIRDTVGTVLLAAAPYALILNENTGATKNDYTVIAGNELLNWTASAIYLKNSGNKAQILNNAMYINTGARTAILFGVNIAATGGNGHLISGNSFGGSTATRGGAALTSSTTVFAYSQLSTTAGDTTIITGNKAGNISGSAVYGVNKSGTVFTDINNNIFGGTATGYSDTMVCTGASNANGNGICVDGVAAVRYNQIRRIKTGGGNASGIFASASSGLLIDHNVIDSVLGTTAIALGANYTPSGIQVLSTTQSFKVRVCNNTISNIVNMNTTYSLNFAGVSGIQLGGNTSPIAVYNNRISAIYGFNANATYGNSIVGIYHGSSTLDSIYNNQIILGDGALPNAWVRGMVLTSQSAVTSTYFNNSVYLKNNGSTPYNSSTVAGVAKGGIQAFYRTNGSPVTLKNNIFYNTATNNGAAMVAATYFNGATVFTSDYNLFYTVDTNKVNYMGATPVAYTLQGWKAVALSDTNSLSATLAFTSATDLHIDATNANAWNVFGRGVAITNITTDIDSNLRSTIMGMPVCIGSDELTAPPSVAPANMVMTPATPVLGTPTVFTSAGRKIAEITWTGATVPTALSAKYYSGVPAPGTITTPNINSYLDVTATPDNGSAYTIKMYYTKAEANGIDESLLKGIKKHATNNFSEISNAGTNAVDVDGRFITSNTLTDFSLFSMTGNTTPLAITLTNISATNVNKANRINWTTATEASSDVFEMERSIDGKSFNAIATVLATGKPGSYTYWDNAALTGKNYYRIKIAQQNGTIVYSNVVEATVADTKAFMLTAYPNPAANNITIHIDGALQSGASILISDFMGKTVKAIKVSTKELNVDLHDLPAGNYIIHYTDGSIHQSIKINKL